MDNDTLLRFAYEHLREMKEIYDKTKLMTDIELFEFLLNQDKAYRKNMESNFAKTVHMLHPIQFKKDE